jgi:hypothetical protein
MVRNHSSFQPKLTIKSNITTLDTGTIDLGYNRNLLVKDKTNS